MKLSKIFMFTLVGAALSSPIFNDRPSQEQSVESRNAKIEYHSLPVKVIYKRGVDLAKRGFVDFVCGIFGCRRGNKAVASMRFKRARFKIYADIVLFQRYQRLKALKLKKQKEQQEALNQPGLLEQQELQEIPQNAPEVAPDNVLNTVFVPKPNVYTTYDDPEKRKLLEKRVEHLMKESSLQIQENVNRIATIFEKGDDYYKGDSYADAITAAANDKSFEMMQEVQHIEFWRQLRPSFGSKEPAPIIPLKKEEDDKEEEKVNEADNKPELYKMEPDREGMVEDDVNEPIQIKIERVKGGDVEENKISNEISEKKTKRDFRFFRLL